MKPSDLISFIELEKIRRPKFIRFNCVLILLKMFSDLYVEVLMVVFPLKNEPYCQMIVSQLAGKGENKFLLIVREEEVRRKLKGTTRL